MTFPKKEIKQNKEQVKSKMMKLFNDADSWEEFCLKANMEFGISVDTIFSRWKLGYIALNYGKPFVFVPLFALLFIVSLTGIALLGFFGLLNLITSLLMIAVFVVSFASIVMFNDFCDELAGIQYYC